MIDRKTRKLAMTASALAAVCVLAAACNGGGDDDDDGFTPELVLKDDGSPANFSCNGSFTDPASTGTAVTMNFLAVGRTTTTEAPSPDTRIAVYNPATGQTNGALAATTMAAGTASIAGVIDRTRYSFKLSRPAGAQTWVDTYTFNVLSPAVGSTSGRYTLRLIEASVRQIFIGLLVSPIPSDLLTTTTQFAGAVFDCDGDPIQNAYVEAPDSAGTGVAQRCEEDDATFPCVAYFAGTTPSKTATDTDASGQVVIVGIPPSQDYTIKVMGVTTAGQSAVQIGELTIRGVADSVSIGSTVPLGP